MTTDDQDRQGTRSENLLHRYVDADLRGAERTAVEALLAADAETLEDVRAYQHQNILLQALHPQRPEDRMLPAAALNLARGLRRRRLARQVAAACLAGVALVGAGAGGWFAQGYVQQVLRSPVVAVFPPSVMPTAPAPADDRATPTSMPAAVEALPEGAAWLGKSAQRVPVHPPNLQRVGYQLVDGRADLTAYGPVIRFAYTPAEGGEAPRLALSVASFGTKRQSLATTINPQHASLFWQSGPLLYALSGDVAPGKLLHVADAISSSEPGAPSGEGSAEAPASGTSDGSGPTLPATPVSEDSETSKEL